MGLHTDALLFSILSTLTHTAVYVSINGMFAYCDAKGIFQEYKLARKPYMIPSTELTKKCLTEAFVSQLIINPIATYFIYRHFLVKGYMLPMSAPLPAVHELALIYFAG